MNQLVNMIMRMVMRKLVNRGVNMGIDRTLGSQKPRADMSPEERAQAKAAGQNAKRAKQGLRTARKIGRF